MPTESEKQKVIDEVNAAIPVHSMWDGFWIERWHRGNLTVSCSFDRIYYRNFDIIFGRVRFYNFPSQWRDTEMAGDRFCRLAEPGEFERLHPGETQTGEYRLAFDMDLNIWDPEIPGLRRMLFTAFVVCDSIGITEMPRFDPDDLYDDYIDPCEYNGYIPSQDNRVKAFRKIKSAV